MATLSSASTLAEIKAAYADNASYEEDASPAKARIFVTACRLLILNLPAMAVHSGESVTLNPALIAAEMKQARTWLATSAEALADSGGAVRHCDFGSFRD